MGLRWIISHPIQNARWFIIIYIPHDACPCIVIIYHTHTLRETHTCAYTCTRTLGFPGESAAKFKWAMSSERGQIIGQSKRNGRREVLEWDTQRPVRWRIYNPPERRVRPGTLRLSHLPGLYGQTRSIERPSDNVPGLSFLAVADGPSQRLYLSPRACCLPLEDEKLPSREVLCGRICKAKLHFITAPFGR